MYIAFWSSAMEAIEKGVCQTSAALQRALKQEVTYMSVSP